MPKWYVHIDETGSFTAGTAGAVVGLLTRGDGPAALTDSLRATWRAEAPEVPWPPHATVLRQPLAWAAWSAPGHRPDLAAAAAALDHSLSSLPAWEMARDRLRLGRLPATPIDMLDATARCRLPAAYATLARRSAEVQEFAKQLLITVAEGGGAWVVSATADTASETTDTPQDADRYLGQLELLLRRATDAVLAMERPGVHELRVRVLTRHVLDPVLNQPVLFNMRHLNTACANASGSADRCSRMERSDGVVTVRLVTDAAQAFDEDLLPGFVLADSLANRMYGVLRRFDCRIDEWCNRLDAACGVPCRLPDHPSIPHRLPLTAADGPPHIWLEGVRAGRISSSDPKALSPLISQVAWTREQAVRWAAYIAGPTPIGN